MFKDERWQRIATALGLAAGILFSPAVANAQKQKGGGGLELPKTVAQAYEVSKTATSDEQLSKVISLCRRGLELKLDARQTAYTRRLASWAYNQRGEVRADAGADDKALTDFQQAVSMERSSWRAIHNRGVSYAGCAKLTEAMADFDEVIRLKQDYPPVWFNRGELRAQLGDFQAAISDYREALRLRPNDTAALSSRGYAFYQLGKYDLALADFTHSLELDSKQPPTLVYRAAAFYETGRYSQAADDCRTAIRLDATSPSAYQATAWLMATCPDARFRDPKLAVKAARKASELRGRSTYRDLETLAAALASDGQFQLAAETQRKAIESLPPHLSELSADFKKRLKLYEHNQPFQETRVARPSGVPKTTLR